MSLPSLVPQSWITACGPAPNSHWMLGAELRLSCLLGKANTLLTKPSPQPQERLSEGDFRYCYFWKQGIGWAEILNFNLVLINEFIRVIPVQRCFHNYSRGDWNLLANISQYVSVSVVVRQAWGSQCFIFQIFGTLVLLHFLTMSSIGASHCGLNLAHIDTCQVTWPMS